MKYFFVKLKQHARMLAAFVLVFGTAAAVLLYALGCYDLSFIDREAVFGPEETSRPVPETSAPETERPPAPPETSAPVPPADDPETSAESARPAEPEQPQTLYTAKIYRGQDLPDRVLRLPTIAEAEANGYTEAPADGTYRYDGTRSMLAKRTFAFPLPARMAFRAREQMQETVVRPAESGEDTSGLVSDEAYVVLETKRSFRPAVELYMGYILLDDGEASYILDRTGKPLCRYDAERYVPAMTRDRQNRPLFRRSDTDLYFYLSADGTRFEVSDYDPVLDNRGLYFDYPASYGTSDSTAVFVKSEERTTEWDAYGQPQPIDPPEIRFGYEVRAADGSVIGPLTGVQYTAAYAFTGNRAAVITEDNRGSLVYINENGAAAYPGMTSYINEYDRWVQQYHLPPLTHGAESLGHYYYDNGLVRVRRQIIDYYNYDVRHLTRVVRDEDVLLRTDGTEVPLPAGYTLESYADGIAVLSKDGRVGLYDVHGEWIAQPIYLRASPMQSGLCALTLPDSRCGMVDKTGAVVLPFTYDFLSPVSSGLIAAYRRENGWSIYTLMDQAPAEP